MKWRASEGKLVLKITDDTTVRSLPSCAVPGAHIRIQCLKFKTYSSIFLNRFEALNLSLMQKMQNLKSIQPAAAVATPGAEPAPATPDTAALLASAATGAASAGGVKKKKPKKKKQAWGDARHL